MPGTAGAELPLRRCGRADTITGRPMRCASVLVLLALVTASGTAGAQDAASPGEVLDAVATLRAGGRRKLVIGHGPDSSLFAFFVIDYEAVGRQLQQTLEAKGFDVELEGASGQDDGALVGLGARANATVVVHVTVERRGGGRVSLAVVVADLRDKRVFTHSASLPDPGWSRFRGLPLWMLAGLVVVGVGILFGRRFGSGSVLVRAQLERTLTDPLFVVRVTRGDLGKTLHLGPDDEMIHALEEAQSESGAARLGGQVTLEGLSPGEARVYVYGGYRIGRELVHRTTQVRDVRIRRGAQVRVELDLVPRDAPVRVRAPRNARVWVDDQEARAQRALDHPVAFTLRRGRHVVHAELDGRLAEQALDVGATPVAVELLGQESDLALLQPEALEIADDPFVPPPRSAAPAREASLLDLDAPPGSSAPGQASVGAGSIGDPFGIEIGTLQATHAQAGAAVAPAPVPSPPPGRYVLVKELGRGAMGCVWRARDTVLERDVALKVIGEDLRTSEKMVELFFKEARALAALNHPSIVQVYDFGQMPALSGSGQDYFIALELVEGQSLEDVLAERGRLSPREALDVMIPVCDALQYAHDRRILHRDIKPANILLTARGAKIMDFGLARVMNEAVVRKTQVSGTPLYMSPEQIKGENLDFRSDLYSLACTFFEMITGRPPFDDEGVLYHHLTTAPPTPSGRGAPVTEDLDAIVVRALSKEKAQRFESIGEFKDTLVKGLA